MINVGAHVPVGDPVAEALSPGVDLVQNFPRSAAVVEEAPPRFDARELKDSPVNIYVHAPYRLNVASPNNRIRIPSRKTLANIVDATEQIGAAGLVVHGGHLTGGEAVEDGFPRWTLAMSGPGESPWRAWSNGGSKLLAGSTCPPERLAGRFRLQAGPPRQPGQGTHPPRSAGGDRPPGRSTHHHRDHGRRRRTQRRCGPEPDPDSVWTGACSTATATRKRIVLLRSPSISHLPPDPAVVTLERHLPGPAVMLSLEITNRVEAPQQEERPLQITDSPLDLTL